MDQIEDKEVARLCSIHYPKHQDDVKPKPFVSHVPDDHRKSQGYNFLRLVGG